MDSQLPLGARLRGRWPIIVTRVVWILLVALALGLFIAAIPVRFNQLMTILPSGDNATVQLSVEEANLLQTRGISLTFYAFYFIAVEIIFVTVFAAIGFLVFWRKSEDRLACFISLTLITFGVLIPATIRAADTPGSGMGWLVHGLQVLGWGSFFTFFYLFPDGQFVPRWTRNRPFLFVGWALAWLLFPAANLFNWPLPLALLVLLAVFTSGGIAQVYRYRRVSGPMERLQTKWVVFGFTAATLGIALFLLPMAYVPGVRQPGWTRVLYHMVGIPFFALSILLIPISIDLAVRRNRLWAIDPIINRTLVYVPLSAILAGVYSASITLSQRLFVAFTGEKSDAPVVLTTLIVVSAVTPIKNSLQTLVDKRFKEAPEPGKKLKAFQEHVRSVIRVLDAAQSTRDLLDQAVRAFDARGGAVHLIEAGQERLLHTYGQWNGEARLSLPLECGGTRYGTLSLGARRNGLEYTAHDQDILQQTAEVVAYAISLRST
jgi:hypothetical protein